MSTGHFCRYIPLLSQRIHERFFSLMPIPAESLNHLAQPSTSSRDDPFPVADAQAYSQDECNQWAGVPHE